MGIEQAVARGIRGKTDMGMIPVVAVALCGADGRVLMARRPRGKQHGGLWEFPGGKVEEGEAPKAAATREMAEELGVAIAADALEPIGFAEGQAAGRTYLLLLYRCRAWQGVPQRLEAEELGWFAPEAIPALDMPPLDYPLARALLRMADGDGGENAG